jgi:hypothetical protein
MKHLTLTEIPTDIMEHPVNWGAWKIKFTQVLSPPTGWINATPTIDDHTIQNLHFSTQMCRFSNRDI